MAGRTTEAGDLQGRQYLSPQEFSARSGLSLATVHRYLRRGRLPFLQPAGPRGRILIPADALERVLGEPCPAGPAQAPGASSTAATAPAPNTTVRPCGPRPKWTQLAGPSPDKEP